MSLVLNVVKANDNLGKYFSPYDCYCILAAKYAGVDVELAEVDIFEAKEHQEEDFAKKTPTKTVPVLEVQGKGTIWESNAIASYICSLGSNKKLKGEGFHAAQVDQVVDLIAFKWPAVQPLTAQAFGLRKLTKPEAKDAETALASLVTMLGSMLDKETFFAGNTITLADLAVFSKLRGLFERHWEPEDRAKLPKSLLRWFNTIAQQEEVEDVLGKTKLKEKVEKKIESKFNLEDWKRTYMNNTPEVYLDYFWKNLDVRVNSIWFADYKYSNELKVVYKTGNLLGGVQQRAQPFNKTTFGVLLVTGTEEQQHLTCLWVFESKTVPKEIVEGIDYEVFDFKRADWKDDKDKVNLYLTSKNDQAGKIRIDGKPILDIKRLL